MKISFLRAGKLIAALILLTGLGCFDIAIAEAARQQATATGQTEAQARAQGQKNYKDRAEYDLYSKVTQTQDPKARLDLLNQAARAY